MLTRRYTCVTTLVSQTSMATLPADYTAHYDWFRQSTNIIITSSLLTTSKRIVWRFTRLVDRWRCNYIMYSWLIRWRCCDDTRTNMICYGYGQSSQRVQERSWSNFAKLIYYALVQFSVYTMANYNTAEPIRDTEFICELCSFLKFFLPKLHVNIF